MRGLLALVSFSLLRELMVKPCISSPTPLQEGREGGEGGRKERGKHTA